MSNPIVGLVRFLDLDDGQGHLALYKSLTLVGAALAWRFAVSGAFWPSVSLFVAILAASFGRNTFLRFLDRHTTTISGKFDTTLTGNVRDVLEGVEPTP